MTTTWGVTPTGFVTKTQTDIIADIEADELATIASDLDVSAESVFGQMNGVVGRQLAICWEQLALCYNAFDPDNTENRLLEMLCKLTGTFRVGNTPSLVTLTCDLNAGTTLVSGTHYANVTDRPDIRWTPRLSLYPTGYVAATSGPQPVQFQSELTGAIQGFAGTINEINTPLAGWNSVVNPNDVDLGLVVDTDPALRTRREKELAIIGTGTNPAVYAAVYKAFSANLQNLAVFENDLSGVDSNGLPGHSVEVLIFDGGVPSINNDALAQVIADSKGGGIQAYGNSSGTAQVTINGVLVPKTMGFSRAVQLPIWLIINLKKKPSGYPGDDKLVQQLATAANAYFGPGDDVVNSAVSDLVFSQGGVKDVTSILLGVANPPTSPANILMDFRSIGRFDTSRIVVNSS